MMRQASSDMGEALSRRHQCAVRREKPVSPFGRVFSFPWEPLYPVLPRSAVVRQRRGMKIMAAVVRSWYVPRARYV